MQIIRQRGYARAGLIGNPSDGYGGKTISIIVRDFHATVILYEWEEIELVLSQEDHSRFGSLDELVRDVQLHGYYGGIRLVKATIKRFVEFCAARRAQKLAGFDLHDGKFAIRYESNIPRQVGLAGSSAIIVATLKALMEFYGIEIPREVQPSLVMSVETDELGISAGLQDRVIQVYGGAVYMDFSTLRDVFGFPCGVYEPLDPAQLPPLYVAFSAAASNPGEEFHNPLRALYDAGDPKIRAAMKQFAEFAAEARQAIQQGGSARLAELINANFDLRRSICKLPPKQIEMVERARGVGASAKFAGSGGAIIGTYTDDKMFQALREELESANCQVIKPKFGDE